MMTRYVTVISMFCGIIEEVFVFPSVNRDINDVVNDAETQFKKLVKSIDGEITDDEMEEYLEDGYLHRNNKKEVHIIWSVN